jgi:hypothetical protein
MKDLIDRWEAIKQLAALSDSATLYDAKRILVKLPAQTAERRRGKWVKSRYTRKVYKCSEGGDLLDFGGVNAGRGDANFCPACGAAMVMGGSEK